MLSDIEPTYDVSVTPSGGYQIVVDPKVSIDSLKQNAKLQQHLLFQEAEKSSLFGMAFVQMLAREENSQASNLQVLYQAYHQFFHHQDKGLIKASCDNILHNKQADSLSTGCAQCLLSLLNNQAIDPSLERSRTLLNRLIPCIEQTLTMKTPQKIYAEQLVRIQEMNAAHNAFPDLIKYDGKYYACFREAASHVSYNDLGRIRVLKGDFNRNTLMWKWENVALLSREGYDLRDPKFFVKHDYTLQMIVGASRISEKNETAMMVPHVAILKNNLWSLTEAKADPSANGAKGQWIWRVTWNPLDHCGYALSYGKGSPLSVMKTADGLTFDKIAEIACEPFTEITEGTLRFQSDGKAIALIRSRKNGIIGTAARTEGYTQWKLNVLPFRVGGPDFLISETENQRGGQQRKMWVATRHFFLEQDNTLDEATIVGLMDESSLVPLLRLKSRFDNSYPGMVLEEDGSVTVIYYSSESKNKSNIYITRVKMPD